jgi:hypothetical protein
MKRFIKLLFEIPLCFIGLVILTTFYFPNLLLNFGIVAVILLIETTKFNLQKKVYFILGILFVVGVYLWIPKQTTTCGALSTGLSCTTLMCRGVPISGGFGGMPSCYGSSMGTSHYFKPTQAQ